METTMNGFYYTFDGTLIYAERFERESEHVVLDGCAYAERDGKHGWLSNSGWDQLGVKSHD